MTNLLNIIENIIALLEPIKTLISGICVVIGFCMTYMAIKQAQRRQEMGPGQGSWNAPIFTFIIAMMFLALPALISILNVSILGTTPTSASHIFTHAKSTIGSIKGADTKRMIVGMVMIIQVLGIIAVCRGLFLLNQSAQGGGQGPKTFGPGFTFVIAGIMATNFPLVVGMMENLLSTP